MDTSPQKRIVRRFYEEVVNTGDVTRIAELISPECIEMDGNTPLPSGIEGVVNHVRGVRTTFPDLHLTVERQIAEGDWVVTVITARGTHQGMWLGMKPTGQKLVFTGVNVDKVIDGRIVEHGGAANMLGPLLEAGALRVVPE